MAVIKNSTFGIISGKLGNVVYVNRQGVNYIRAKAKVYKKSASKTQQDTRLKFALMFQFLKPFAELLAIGFHEQAKGKTGYNVAMSYNLKNAITGSSPDFKVSLFKTLLCMGPLPMPQNPFMTMTVSNIIVFNWNYDKANKNGDPNDLAVLIAFFEDSKRLIYQITLTRREIQKALLTIPEDLYGQKAYCWMAFKSVSRASFSNSVCLGAIIV
jgi:hypothetical protein